MPCEISGHAMISPNSMNRASTLQSAQPGWRSIVATLVITTLAVIFLSPLGSWRKVAFGALYGFTYTICIGSLAWLTLPRIGERSRRLKPTLKWAMAISSMIAIAIVGSLAALAVLATLGFFPWSHYWARFWADLRS